MPMCVKGNSKAKSSLLGSLNGLVEPLGGLLVVLLATWLTPILPNSQDKKKGCHMAAFRDDGFV